MTVGATVALALLGPFFVDAAESTPLPAATGAATATPPSASPAPSIGTATMEPDGTIVLQLRAQTDDGTIAETQLRIKPGAPSYAPTLQHLGGLKPGETKPVAPWPEDPKK